MNFTTCNFDQIVKKDCNSCVNRCMDMDLDPYCAHSEVLKRMKYGQALHTGTPVECGPEYKLWSIDTRRKLTHAALQDLFK